MSMLLRLVARHWSEHSQQAAQPAAAAHVPNAPATTPEAHATALAIKGLTVSYGNAPALFSVDFSVPAGTMGAIVGPNGAGKSTLVKAALGIVPRVSGDVRVFGEAAA